MYLHGGPESQDRPVYNSLYQSLVAAGIAVFAANVRGSSGFGRSFVHADDRDKRHAAVTDVADCVAHLLAEGVAQPGRAGVMGRSYGGWLTLAALVEHPELFAVGVDVCGMADFATFYAGTEPWIAAAAVAEYGHPEHDAELLRALSPIHRIDRLTAPLLVVHGGQDTNVPLGEAEQVVAALAARGAEHRFLMFPDEGHDLLATPNRVAFVRETVAWVTRHLGWAPHRTPGDGRRRSVRGGDLLPDGLAELAEQLGEPGHGRVEALAALDPRELDGAQLVAAVLVVADDAAARRPGPPRREVGASA